MKSSRVAGEQFVDERHGIERDEDDGWEQKTGKNTSGISPLSSL